MASDDIEGTTKYPIVPGHELAGVVEAIGASLTKFKPGDHIGVGCLVDSCLTCSNCTGGKEQKCSSKGGFTYTYGASDKYGRACVWPPESGTLGGYTDRMVIHERFGIKIPEGYPLECAGPIMCSGVTSECSVCV